MFFKVKVREKSACALAHVPLDLRYVCGNSLFLELCCAFPLLPHVWLAPCFSPSSFDYFGAVRMHSLMGFRLSHKSIIATLTHTWERKTWPVKFFFGALSAFVALITKRNICSDPLNLGWPDYGQVSEIEDQFFAQPSIRCVSLSLLSGHAFLSKWSRPLHFFVEHCLAIYLIKWKKICLRACFFVFSWYALQLKPVFMDAAFIVQCHCWLVLCSFCIVLYSDRVYFGRSSVLVAFVPFGVRLSFCYAFVLVLWAWFFPFSTPTIFRALASFSSPCVFHLSLPPSCLFVCFCFSLFTNGLKSE